MMITTDVISAAQAAARKWKVPASVSLAQWLVESGGGLHEPPGSNNPFGIKMLPGLPFVEAKTHEFSHGRYVTITARFAKFANIADAFDWHAQLIATRPAYRPVMHATGPEDFARKLTGIYATDPEYGDKLIQAMRSHELEKFDV